MGCGGVLGNGSGRVVGGGWGVVVFRRLLFEAGVVELVTVHV